MLTCGIICKHLKIEWSAGLENLFPKEFEPVEVLSDEEIVKELCKVLAIRYGYADGETIDWIVKNIIATIAQNNKEQLYRRVK